MLMMYHLLHELDTSAIYSFKETKELGVFGERFQILSDQKLENIAFIIILITVSYKLIIGIRLWFQRANILILKIIKCWQSISRTFRS